MVSDPRQIIDIQMYAHRVIFQHAFSCLLMDGLFIKEGYSSAQERLNVLHGALKTELMSLWFIEILNACVKIILLIIIVFN